MKILQVIEFFTPSCGGSVKITYNLSKGLAKLGHEVTIVTTDFKFDKEYVKSIEKEGVIVIPFHCVANIESFLISPSIKKWLKENIENFNIIHMHNFRSYQNKVVYRYAKKYNIPYLLQAHGSVLPFFEKQRLKKVYDLIWGYNILKNTSKVIALTKTEAEQYKKMGVNADKIEIVPNGINLPDYKNLPEWGEFRKKFAIGRHDKVILSLGRIHKIKGLDLLVNAFSDIARELDNVKLVIVGPDDGFLSTLKKQIKALNIEDRVLVTGPLYGTDKLRAYIDANVYVLPSVYEAFSNTILEALVCGTPVIVTDRCGIADVIDKIGYVVEYDKSKLTDAILELLECDDLRVELGEKGKKLMKEEFNFDDILKKVEKVYFNLI